MIRLRQTHGADSGRELEFDRELIRIGRMPDSDVNFDPEVDLDASGRHAEIRKEGDRWVLVDAGSRNGTWLNGERVKHANLKDGDEIEFGTGGPRMVVDEASDRELQKPTARLAPSETADPAAPVPATDMPDALDAWADVTDPMDKPLFSQPDVAIEFRSDEEPTRDTLRVPPHGLGNWVLMGALVVLAVAAVSIIVRHDRSPASIPDGTLAKIRADASGALWRIEDTSVASCMAFNVGPRLLATTASCVRAVQEAKSSGTEPKVTNAAGSGLTITRMWKHPGPSASAGGSDLGLIEVVSSAGDALPIATTEVLAELSVGQPLLVFGDLGGAEGVVLAGIDALGPQEKGGGALLRYSHTAFAGAPVLDADGYVVGVHTANDSAIRADLLRAMIAGLNQ